jgi:hypothetical protein
VPRANANTASAPQELPWNDKISLNMMPIESSQALDMCEELAGSGPLGQVQKDPSHIEYSGNSIYRTICYCYERIIADCLNLGDFQATFQQMPN